MMDIIVKIWDFIADKWPVVGFFIAVIVVTAFVAIKIYKYYNSLENTKNKVKNLQCEKRKSEIDKLSSFEKTLNSINDRFEEVCKWIMKKDNTTIDFLAPKHSPRKMNSIGEEVYVRTGAKAVFDENRELFLRELADKSPKTAYDVEDNAFDVLLSSLPLPIFNKLKNYLYNSPSSFDVEINGEKKSIELTMGTLLQLMSISLRDAYLSEHPEILPED